MSLNYEYQPTCQIPPETLDKLYMDAFGFKKNGTLVEIGAHDGWHWSNTWGLARIGWRAIYVEPVTDLYHECKRTHASHKNVTVKRCAIGPKKGIVQLGMCEYGASVNSHERAFHIRQTTLDLLLGRFVQPSFDLLVIDVEGGEAGVLAGFTVSKWHPKLVIIERPPVPNIILDFGYRQVYSDWINTVYEHPTTRSH